MESNHAVLFDGTVSHGADIDGVKEKLAALFKASPHQVARMFTGKPVVLKKGLTAEAAQKFVRALNKTGALAKVVRLGAAEAPAPASLTADDLARYFAGVLPRHGLSLTYRLGLLATAVIMLLLPVLYVALTVAVGASLFWYFAAVPFPHRINPMTWLWWLAVPAAAGTILFFMLKPLFAPRTVSRLPVELNRGKEPLFFAFVNAVADKVGAPRPHTIEVDCRVNAAAAYYRDFHGLTNNKLTLIVGLPLVAGMNTRQLAGILAHEFGHFAQRGGMFATYVVRRINYWFYRAVHERDGWDERLERTADAEGTLGFLAGVAAIGVGLVRRLLGAFLWVAEVTSYYMLRQMEFDADSYEARLAGSAQFRETSLQLRRLDHAFREVYDDLGELWNRRQLVDDLPSMVARKAGGLSAATLQQLEEAMREEQQNVFATHPPDDARVARAQALKAPGVFTVERPAHLLLKDFDGIARQASLRFYRGTLELPVKEEQLVSKEAMASAVAEARQQDQALNDYCRGLFLDYRFLAPWEPSRFTQFSDEARRQKLDELVLKIRQSLPDIDKLRADFERLSDLLAAAYARQILGQQPNANIAAMAKEISPKEFVALQQELGLVKARLAPLEAALSERMGVALAGVLQSAACGSADKQRLLQAVKLTQVLTTLQTPRDDLFLHGAVLFYAMQADQLLRQRTSGAEGLTEQFFETWRRSTTNSIDNISAALDAVAYPFERAGGSTSVSKHLREHLPPRGSGLVEHAQYIAPFFHAVQAQYTQAMRYLADVAHRYEAGLGVMPVSIRLRGN